jgi:hypothetical protein
MPEKLPSEFKGEQHLFIIWENGRTAEQEILVDLQQRFYVEYNHLVCWTPQVVHDNYSRIYGQNLPLNSFKEIECGRGPFRLIVVRDAQPVYEPRQTTGGTNLVNTNIFDLKQKYRHLTGGGHRIHASDDLREAQLQLRLLRIENQTMIDPEATNPIQPKIVYQDLLGSSGWSTIEEFLNFINQSLDYVVLRSDTSKLKTTMTTGQGDIDILTPCRRTFWYLVGAPKAAIYNDPSAHVIIAGREILFDVTEFQDGELSNQLQIDMLKSRSLINNIFFPDPVTNISSKIYKALALKGKNLNEVDEAEISASEIATAISHLELDSNNRQRDLKAIFSHMETAAYLKANLPANFDKLQSPGAQFIQASFAHFAIWKIKKFSRKIISTKLNWPYIDVTFFRRLKCYATISITLRNRLFLTIRLGSIS